MAELKQRASILYSDLDLEFTKNPITSDVSIKTDVNAVKQALRILILSNYYERPFKPKLGANLKGFFFENMDILSAKSIEKTILNLIENYDKRIRINEVKVPLLPSLIDRNSFTVSIHFYVLGIEKPQNLTINLERLR